MNYLNRNGIILRDGEIRSIIAFSLDRVTSFAQERGCISDIITRSRLSFTHRSMTELIGLSLFRVGQLARASSLCKRVVHGVLARSWQNLLHA